MNRFFKTLALALVIVGGLWVLFNQQQIQQAGGLSAYIAQNFRSSTSNAFQQSGWNQHSDWTAGSSQFPQTASNSLPLNRFSRGRTGSRPDLSPISNTSDPFQFASQRSLSIGSRPGLPAPSANKIRIASFKMNAHSDPAIQLRSLELLTDLCSQFDIVAFQEINSQSISLLEQIGQRAAAKSNGAIQFRAISDVAKVGPGNPLFVILYNTTSLDLDFANWYSVNDPDQLLTREPLVGWFRTRGVDSEKAFTFTLANIQLDDHRPDLELAYIGDLFRAIRQDGRGEDDVIITGNFNAGDRGLSAMRERAGLTWVVYDTATSTDKESQYDNLVFAQNATVEFTGQGGVLDFLSAYNLPLADANAISQHMPVWAEFSTVEGGQQVTSMPPLDAPNRTYPDGTPINRPSF
jgi:hypothetical protein